MSAAQRIVTDSEADIGFGFLKDIIEMVKNPKGIDEAYARRQKAAQLTDEEVIKSQEARTLIASADELRKVLKQREDDLEVAKSDQKNAFDDEFKKIKSATESLENREKELAKLASEQEGYAVKLKERSDALDLASEMLESKKAELDRAFNDKKSQQDATEIRQKEEDARLTEWAAKLKAKAQRLAAEAAS